MTSNPFNNFGGAVPLGGIGQGIFQLNPASQAVPMTNINTSNYTYFNRDTTASVSNQGARALSEFVNKSWWYTYSSGGYIPYNNGSTMIVTRNAPAGNFGTINIQNASQRVWFRELTSQSIGTGGNGGNNFQGFAAPGTGGSAVVVLQGGVVNEFVIRAQGIALYGSGGGGGAGVQGRRTTQGLPYTFATLFAPSGGGSGGGGAGFGTGGALPDARYQGGAGHNGTGFLGGAGGGGGGGQGAGGGGGGGQNTYNGIGQAGQGSGGSGGAGGGLANPYPNAKTYLY